MDKTNISSKDVARIAGLARLKLDNRSLKRYASQLRQVLSYVANVNEIAGSSSGKIDKIVTPQHKLENITRDDRVANGNIGAEELLSNVPSRKRNMISVPT